MFIAKSIKVVRVVIRVGWLVGWLVNASGWLVGCGLYMYVTAHMKEVLAYHWLSAVRAIHECRYHARMSLSKHGTTGTCVVGGRLLLDFRTCMVPVLVFLSRLPRQWAVVVGCLVGHHGRRYITIWNHHANTVDPIFSITGKALARRQPLQRHESTHRTQQPHTRYDIHHSKQLTHSLDLLCGVTGAPRYTLPGMQFTPTPLRLAPTVSYTQDYTMGRLSSGSATSNPASPRTPTLTVMCDNLRLQCQDEYTQRT
jgi:hypothetical protein